MWEEEFDLNSVRLCFQASFTQPTGERLQLVPVVSQPIYDNREHARPHTHTHTRVSAAGNLPPPPQEPQTLPS